MDAGVGTGKGLVTVDCGVDSVHPVLWIRLSPAFRASDRQGCKSYGAPLGPLLLPLLWLSGHKSNWRSDCYRVLTPKLWQWHGSPISGLEALLWAMGGNWASL